MTRRPHAPGRRLDLPGRPGASRAHASRSTCRRRTASRCPTTAPRRSSWSVRAPASRRSASFLLAPQGAEGAGPQAWLFFGHQRAATRFLLSRRAARAQHAGALTRPRPPGRATGPRRSTCRTGCARPAPNSGLAQGRRALLRLRRCQAHGEGRRDGARRDRRRRARMSEAGAKDFIAELEGRRPLSGGRLLMTRSRCRPRSHHLPLLRRRLRRAGQAGRHGGADDRRRSGAPGQLRAGCAPRARRWARRWGWRRPAAPPDRSRHDARSWDEALDHVARGVRAHSRSTGRRRSRSISRASC